MAFPYFQYKSIRTYATKDVMRPINWPGRYVRILLSGGRHEDQPAYGRADHQDPRTGREGRTADRCGVPRTWHCREHLLSLAQSLWQHVDQRGPTAEGSGEGERSPQAPTG